VEGAAQGDFINANSLEDTVAEEVEPDEL